MDDEGSKVVAAAAGSSSMEIQGDPGKMFIGGLHSQTTAESLEKHFSVFGELKESVVMRDPMTKRSRGFGFVTFANTKCVDDVLNQTHIIDGKKVDPKRAIPKRTTASSPQMRKVFVGGLLGSTSSADLREYFETYGKVTEVLLMYDKSTQRLRGFGFVTFESDAVAKQVCEDGFHKIKSKNVECKPAQPKEVMSAYHSRARPGLMGRGYGSFLDSRGFGIGMPSTYSYGFPDFSSVDPQFYQLMKYDAYARGRGRARTGTPLVSYPSPGYPNFPSGAGSFMGVPEGRRGSSYFYQDFLNMPQSGRSRAEHHSQAATHSVSSSSIPPDYEYAGQYASQQGSLGPTSPLNHHAFSQTNPGASDISYVSSARQASTSHHDMAGAYPTNTTQPTSYGPGPGLPQV